MTEKKESEKQAHPAAENLLAAIGRGDYFNPEYHSKLQLASCALQGAFPANKLFEELHSHFTHYTDEQQNESLDFIKSYLSYDTNNELIPLNYENSPLIERIDSFCESALEISHHRPEIEDRINDISDLLINKIVEKGQIFIEYSRKIESGDIPSATLLRRINTINEMIDKDPSQLELNDYFMEISEIIKAPNLLSFKNNYFVSSIQKALNHFCELMTPVGYEKQIKKLKKNIAESFKNPSSLRRQSAPIETVPHFELQKIFYEITHGQMSIQQYEYALESLIHEIEQGFLKHFSEIDLSELRGSVWTYDPQRIKANLLPKSPHIRKYYQYYHLVEKYIALQILYKTNQEGNIIPREKLTQIRQVHDFIEKAIHRAVEIGAIATARALDSALNSSMIARLRLAKQAKKSRFRPFDKDESQQQLNEIAVQYGGAPFLKEILNKIASTYEQEFNSELDKLTRIGQELKSFLNTNQAVKLRINNAENSFSEMLAVMKIQGLLLLSDLTDDIIINPELFSKLMGAISLNIRPSNIKNYPLSHFDSITALKEHLVYCHNRLLDFHLTDPHPQKAIIDFMLAEIKKDDDFQYFGNSIKVLELINLISHSKRKSYLQYDRDLAKILTTYHSKLKHLFKTKATHELNQLSRSFTEFVNNAKIQSLMEAPTGLNPFSIRKKLKRLIQSFTKIHTKFYHQAQQAESERSQSAYGELLQDILKGEKPVILPYTAQSEISTEDEEIDYLGYDFPPDELPLRSEKQSVLASFSSNNIQNEFHQSFPWAEGINTLEDIEMTDADLTLNLLGTDTFYPPEIQLEVMKSMLISVDALGKVAGFKGELSVINFIFIKTITDALQKIADLIAFPEAHSDPLFSTTLSQITQEINAVNEQFYTKSQNINPLSLAHNNLNMNQFCHIKERLVYKLLGIPFQKSVLLPRSPAH